jgi:hypothetical protein
MEDGTVLRILTYEDCSSTLLLTEEEYHQEGKLYVRPLMEYLAEKDVETTTQAGEQLPVRLQVPNLALRKKPRW